MLRNFIFLMVFGDSRTDWSMMNTRAQVPRHDSGKKESPKTNPYSTWNGSVIFADLPIVYSAACGRAEKKSTD